MAAKNQFNIYTTYYESFLALSVSITVGKHQLMMETPCRRAPVLRYRDITITTETLKELLIAVCPLRGVHNVARVRQGALPLVEVDFTDEKALGRFCKSIIDGVVTSQLQERLESKLFFGTKQKVDVTVKLHLIMPNAEKKSPVSREVTTANYRECFSLVRESALFQFAAFSIAHDIIIEEPIEQMLGIDDLEELFQELTDVATNWLTVGTFLKIAHHKLQDIGNDYDDSMDCLREVLVTWLRETIDASPTALVLGLRSAGMVVLADKVAIKHGVTSLPEADECENADLIGIFGPQVYHQEYKQDVNELTSQRKINASKDTHHHVCDKQLTGLKNCIKKVTEEMKSVKDQIDKLILDQESLIEKREKKQSSRQLLIEKRASMSREDLAELNKQVRGIEKGIIDISNQIDELRTKIQAQNEQVAEMKAQLVQLEIKMNEVKKERDSLEFVLEKERKKFEEMTLSMKIRLSENVEGSALVSKGEKSIGQRALRLKLPISQVIDELNEVKAQLAQKEQEIQHLKMEQAVSAMSADEAMSNEMGKMDVVQATVSYHGEPNKQNAQVINEASKPKPQNVEDSASVDNAPLVSKGEKRPVRRQRARTSVIPPISEAIDKLGKVNAQLLAQKAQELQQINELEEVNAQLLAQKKQQIDELNEVKAQLRAQKVQELQQINELEEVKAQLAKTEQELQHLKPLRMEQPHGRTIDEKDYFGIIDSSQAEAKCCNTGYYLVRHSAEQKKYFLTVNWKGKGIHIPIQEISPVHSGSGISYCIEDMYFGSISELLDHYAKSQRPITQTSGAVLTKFVSCINESLIRHDDIKRKQKISSGVFGNVYKALFQNERVVVKTCEHMEDKNRFLHEAGILKRYEHPNIVQLKGVVTEQFPLYIIMEIMSAMSLYDSLRKQATSYTNEQLRMMCAQVCTGMKYLEENGQIHRNLMAQNCIVDERGFVKISGFGMNRKRKNGMHKILFKWTSPEVLNFGKYSSASDVWSFGILTWEVFSLGATPYPGMTDKQVSQEIEVGYRMSPPANCPDSAYDVMLKCWNYDEENRPTFAELYPMVCELDIS